jgi:hypothetical protein
MAHDHAALAAFASVNAVSAVGGERGQVDVSLEPIELVSVRGRG